MSTCLKTVRKRFANGSGEPNANRNRKRFAVRHPRRGQNRTEPFPLDGSTQRRKL